MPEIRAIRNSIGPRRDTQGVLSFPEVFSPHTRMRNWLMFEVALELGIRRGELLKLRLDSLPRGADDGIRVLRRPDDPHDSRSKEPAVKTAERVIPSSRNLLAAMRCHECHGRVVAMKDYSTGAKAHFEHQVAHKGCSTKERTYCGIQSFHPHALK